MNNEHTTSGVKSTRDLLTITAFIPGNFSVRLNTREKELRLAAI
jgi:hypothetical protein